MRKLRTVTVRKEKVDVALQVLRRPQTISHAIISGGRNCSVCLCLFDNRRRRPKILPCGHSYCCTCISDNISNGKIVCPACEKNHEASSVDSFPYNHGLEALIKREFNVGSPVDSDVSDSEASDSESLGESMESIMERKALALAKAEILYKESSSLSSQLQHYATQLDIGKKLHQNFICKLKHSVETADCEMRIEEYSAISGRRGRLPILAGDEYFWRPLLLNMLIYIICFVASSSFPTKSKKKKK